MRRLEKLNDNWSFWGLTGKSEEIDIPHTWNALDGQDGGDDYWRGSCTYRKYFKKPTFDSNSEEVYIEFCGVNSSADVKVNGVSCAHHDGGYSTFRMNITKLLIEENELEVVVDNGVNNKVYPQKADFTFYGGIYRDVNVIIVNKYHFSLDFYGGSGMKVTPRIEGEDAFVQVECWHNAINAQVEVIISDANGQVVAKAITENNVDGNTVYSAMNLQITNPHLWDGIKDPYLYRINLQLKQEETLYDEISSPFGVRSFYVDAQKGFFLNGRSYPLHGVSRHQDRKGIGNALHKEHHEEDMMLIRELGANTIRLAHYQHDQYFYDLCDRHGMIVWAEIPYISEHMPSGRENTITQAKELVIQNFNHPCIVCWGISNEITISTKNQPDMLDNHCMLHDLYHQLDDTRLTTVACYAMCGPFHKSAHISDLVSWNLYLGWYVPGLFLNDLWLGFFHMVYPKRPLGFSEYGCEGMPNLHSDHPRRGDHSEEYQAKYHEFMLKCFQRHPYMWSTHVWNMFDFAADARNQGGEPGMNHKGLVTFDRKIKKDSFYLYKAYWSEEPFVHIVGKRYKDRTNKKMQLKVYSNQLKVRVFQNGRLLSEKEGDKVFIFPISLDNINEIEVIAGECRDCAVFNVVDNPNPEYKLKKTKSKSANWV